MITRLLSALGAILVIVAVLKLVGVVHFASAAAGTLLVVGIVLLVASWFFGGTRRGTPL